MIPKSSKDFGSLGKSLITSHKLELLCSQIPFGEKKLSYPFSHAALKKRVPESAESSAAESASASAASYDFLLCKSKK